MHHKKFEAFSAQLGEVLQHDIAPNGNLMEVGDWYYGFLENTLRSNPKLIRRPEKRYLEIAPYRHILGYRLAKDYGFESYHFDICDADLEEGRRIAEENGYEDNVCRVIGDFHDLPFADNSMDFVVVSASIHHTRTPEKVIGEIMRVLADDGVFYCQREPCERLFCFHQFAANRPDNYTPFERKLHDTDMMRIVSSAYPGARNAELFDRVENDRITIDWWFDTLSKYGTIVEHTLFYEGLLTTLDKKVLENTHLSEFELALFIREELTQLLEASASLFSVQDHLLGYSFPTLNDIDSKAREVAAALKARPKNEKSLDYKRAMANIFAASLRFSVRRQRDEKQKNSEVFRRELTTIKNCQADNRVYKDFGIDFWTRLLPNVTDGNENDLTKAGILTDDWTLFVNAEKRGVLTGKSGQASITPKLDVPAALTVRYSVLTDKDMPWCRVNILMDDEVIDTFVAASSEHRTIKYPFYQSNSKLTFKMETLDGNEIDLPSRLRIYIAQALPITNEELLA